jgi:hypothetical protein
MLPLRHGIRGAPSPKVPNHTARCVIQLIVRSSQKCEQWSSSKIASCLCCTRGYLCLNNTKTVATKHHACVGSAPDWFCFSGSGVGSGVGEEDSYHSISTAFTKTTFALSVMA